MTPSPKTEGQSNSRASHQLAMKFGDRDPTGREPHAFEKAQTRQTTERDRVEPRNPSANPKAWDKHQEYSTTQEQRQQQTEKLTMSIDPRSHRVRAGVVLWGLFRPALYCPSLLQTSSALASSFPSYLPGYSAARGLAGGQRPSQNDDRPRTTTSADVYIRARPDELCIFPSMDRLVLSTSL